MDYPWEKSLAEFLKRTRDELRRAAEEMRGEAQKVFDKMGDPHNQQRLRDTLMDLGTWARKVADEAGQMLDGAVSRAQEALAGGGPQSREAPASEPAQPKPRSKARAPARKASGAGRTKGAPKPKARPRKKR